ncbi:MAG: hypothetical protein Q7S74_05405 [Nanoarchaeota archaeon]|nr:hypothetical protein [Nanoarchaeota archaeon]
MVGRERELYVFMDDSNNGRKPLIVVAYFSRNRDDTNFKVRQMISGRNFRELGLDYETIIRIMDRRDNYRFIEDYKERLGTDSRHLVLAASPLIENFLDISRENYERICIFLDGQVSSKDRDFIKEEVALDCEKKGYDHVSVNVEGVIKRKPTFKYPEGLRIADGVAHVLYTYPALRKKSAKKGKEVIFG